MVHKTLIVGCGKIAGGYDQMSIDNTIKTHARAYSQNPHFQIDACVEPDNEKKNAFCNYWGVKDSFNDLSEIDFKSHSFDVISICSPSNLHYKHLKQSLAFRPKLIFCEKPLCLSLNESIEIVDECKNNNTKLVVNYSRRFDRTFRDFKDKIYLGKFGKLRSISAIYNKGLYNHGSHLIDILIFLLGDLNIDYVGLPIYDYSDEDPSFPLVLSDSNNVPINISCGNANDYFIFDINFYFEKAKISSYNGGTNWSFQYLSAKNDIYGNKFLDNPSYEEGTVIDCMPNAINSIRHVLENKINISINSSGEDSLKTLKICNDIRKKL